MSQSQGHETKRQAMKRKGREYVHEFDKFEAKARGALIAPQMRSRASCKCLVAYLESRSCLCALVHACSHSPVVYFLIFFTPPFLARPWVRSRKDAGCRENGRGGATELL